MKQSRYRYLGILDLVLVAAFVGFFGQTALTSNVAIPGMAVAGVLALLAGSVSELSAGHVTVTWRHLIGASYAIFAFVLPSMYVPRVLAGSATGEEIILLVASVAGGFSLLFYGVDVARGGRHFEVDADVGTADGG